MAFTEVNDKGKNYCLEVTDHLPKMQKSRAGPLDLPGFLCLGLSYFSAIIFPVDFRERCAKLPARNGKKIREIHFRKYAGNIGVYRRNLCIVLLGFFPAISYTVQKRLLP